MVYLTFVQRNVSHLYEMTIGVINYEWASKNTWKIEEKNLKYCISTTNNFLLQFTIDEKAFKPSGIKHNTYVFRRKKKMYLKSNYIWREHCEIQN